LRKLITILLINISVVGLAQRLTDIKTLLVGTGVDVRFTVTKGTSCNGYTILHSLDSVYFLQVYHYPGVCGNSISDENVSFLHTNTSINTFNYYKIELVPIESSFVQRIFVPELPNAKAIVYPNPIITNSDQLSFRILNSNNIKLKGFIYSEEGLRLRVLDLTTTIDIAKINVGDLINGIYSVQLNDGEKNYTYKFIINR
jgi:hypothetical protein